jgi:hypothetical protein
MGVFNQPSLEMGSAMPIGWRPPALVTQAFLIGVYGLNQNLKVLLRAIAG